MLFSRFLQLRDLLLRVKREEVRERFTAAAFTAWLMGAGSGKKFGEYLEDLGVLEKAEGVSILEDEEMSAKDAIAKAEEILRMSANKEG